MSKGGLFRDCAKCGLPVHHKSAACKAGGETSPWATGSKEPEPAAVASEPPAAAGGALPAAEFGGELTDRDIGNAIDALKSHGVKGPYTLLQAGKPPVRIVESPAVNLNPDDSEVAVFLHRLTTPSAEAEVTRIAAIEALNGPHVFLDKFSCMVGPTMAHFKAGQTVSDFALLQALKAENAPMVPAAVAPGMTCCPQCRHVFRVPTLIPAKRAG